MLEPIMLVEDNDQDEMLTLRALRRSGVTNPVQVARDGQEAVDMLLDQGLRPVVVILDLSLPRLSGLEVLERIRAHEATRMLPVVILTSSDEERDRLTSYLHGANAFVHKPVDFNEFAETVIRLGVFWALTNEAPPRR